MIQIVLHAMRPTATSCIFVPAQSVPSDRLLLSSSSDINEQPQALTTSQVSSTIHARSSSGYGGGSASLAISPPTSSRSSAVTASRTYIPTLKTGCF